jgi:hypothetical protein
MATFPSYACVMLEGYSEMADYLVLRSEMDNSIAKQRPRRSIPVVMRSVKIRVNDKADKILFDAWFKNDIFGGTAWFTYVDPVDGASKQARFVEGKLTWTSPGVAWFGDAELETLG